MYFVSSICFCCLLLISGAQAQIQATLREESRSMSQGTHNALVLDLPGANAKDVAKLWGSFVKEFKGKTQTDRKTGETFTDDATIKSISENTLDLYVRVLSKGTSGCELQLWINVGLDYLNSGKYPAQYGQAEDILKRFTNLASLSMMESELKAQQKRLKDLEKQLGDLVKIKGNTEKSINKNREAIAKLEAEIRQYESALVQNANDQGNKQGEIDTQKAVIDNIEKRIGAVKGRK